MASTAEVPASQRARAVVACSPTPSRPCRRSWPVGFPAVRDQAPRGPTTVEDWIETRIVELVVHADDLNRSLPGP